MKTSKSNQSRNLEDTLATIRVCLVGPIPPPFGGIPTYVQNLVNSKIPEVEYCVVDTKFPEWVAPESREGKTQYNSFVENGLFSGFKKVYYSIFHYCSYIKKIIYFKPDIVQVFTCSYWGYWRNLIFVLIAKFFGKKTIFHLLNAIDDFYNNSGKLGKKLIRWSLNVADVYLLQSPGLKNWLDQYSQKRTYGLWNSIDLAIIPACPISPKKVSNREITGITVGKLGKNKGTYDILDAIERLQKNSDVIVKWIFAGTGNMEHFQVLANNKGLEKNIVFTGPVSDQEKWNYLYQADFFCLPSYTEGQPISIIEAMSIGLPVISTTVGSIPEMITDSINGLLIPPGNVEMLVGAIVKMNDQNLRDSIGKTAKENAKLRFDHSEFCKNLVDIYKDMLIS